MTRIVSAIRRFWVVYRTFRIFGHSRRAAFGAGIGNGLAAWRHAGDQT